VATFNTRCTFDTGTDLFADLHLHIQTAVLAEAFREADKCEAGRYQLKFANRVLGRADSVAVELAVLPYSQQLLRLRPAVKVASGG